MEVYLYGTTEEVYRAQRLLRPAFPEITRCFPVYDLPDTPEQQYCRIYYECRESED